MSSALANRLQPLWMHRHRDIGAAAALAAVWVVMAFAAGRFDTFPGDVAALEAVQRVFGNWYGPVGDSFNGFIHNYGVRLAWVASIAGLMFAHRSVDAAVFIAVAVVSPLTTLGKLAVARPRPDAVYGYPDYAEATSFPSGHTTQEAAFFGLWFALAGVLLPAWLVLPVRVVCVVAILLTGLSRIWAGAHWPSDVFGSVVFGTALVFALLALRSVLDRRLRPRKS